ncbi:hypothetical protein [Thermococcus prieurii]
MGVKRVKKTRVVLECFDSFTFSPIKYPAEFVFEKDAVSFAPPMFKPTRVSYTRENAKALYELLRAFAERVRMEEEINRLI